jgi:hypothetical protein
VLIISRTWQLGASPKKADANCMRAKIVIDKFGTTRTGDTNEPPPGGVTARRSNRDFVVKLDADASYPALISLIRTLRAVDGDMTLADDTASPMSREELCLKLAHRAFANIVRTRRKSQTIYYSIDDTDVLRILRLLEHIYTDDPTMQRTKH